MKEVINNILATIIVIVCTPVGWIGMIIIGLMTYMLINGG